MLPLSLVPSPEEPPPLSERDPWGIVAAVVLGVVIGLAAGLLFTAGLDALGHAPWQPPAPT